MFCSISGEVPREPVVCKATGHLYERSLIAKHLQDTAEANGRDGSGTCPMTGQPVNLDTDFIELQANKAVKPRAVASSSIPGMLAMFQNEWDELMLESFTLKQHLDATRQELSQALYQHDAACRVIARLMRERDEARGMLASLAVQGVDTSGAVQQQTVVAGDAAEQQMEVEEQQSTGLLGADVLAVLSDKCAELSKGRKGRKPPAELASKDAIVAGCGASSALSMTPHATSKPGVTCLAMCETSDQSGYMSLSGGMDKMGFLTNLSTGKVISKLVGHSKKVTAVALHSHSQSGAAPTAFTASADCSVKVWAAGEKAKYANVATIADHSAEVCSLSVHPTGDYLVSVSEDNSWCFMDVARGSTVIRVENDSAEAVAGTEKYSCGELHPDGLILACGTSAGAVRLWDIREQKNVASLGDSEGGSGHSAAVTCLNFNQNGYLLASGGNDSVCNVWDLRKLKNVASLESSSKQTVTSLAFDHSGVYLAYGSNSAIDISVVKEWTCVASLTPHTKAVTGLAWGKYASFLLSSSLDRTIKKQSFSE